MFLFFSQNINEPINILEVLVYDLSSAGASNLAFLGILFLLSHLPFKNDETFELLRLTKLKWILSKIIYVFCTIMLYYIIIFLFSSLIIWSISFCGNMWSYPMYVLTMGDDALRVNSGLTLNMENILNNFSPLSAVIILFVLTVLYSLTMVLLNMFFNTLYVNGVAVTITIHAFGYFIAYYIPKYSKLSLISHEILNNHFFDTSYSNLYYPTLKTSIILFATIILLEIIMFIIFIRKCDCIHVIENEYEN